MGRAPLIRNQLLRRELPWLVADVVLLLILFNANAPELWFWLVVLLVVLAYRYERWWSSRPKRRMNLEAAFAAQPACQWAHCRSVSSTVR